VRQGDTLSPKLFSATVELVFRKLRWHRREIRIDGKHLSHLRFAEDIVLFAHSAEEATEMLEEMIEQIERVGLEINYRKTLAMSNCDEDDIASRGTQIKYTEEFVYLGHKIAMDQKEGREIGRRIQAGWAAFTRYKDFFQARIVTTDAKRRLFNACVLPVLCYGAEV